MSRGKVGASLKTIFFWRTVKLFRNLIAQYGNMSIIGKKDRSAATAQVNVGRPKKTVKYTVEDAVKLVSISSRAPVKIAIVNRNKFRVLSRFL
jgi:hypothetical protein